jgi:hypothetical protein
MIYKRLNYSWVSEKSIDGITYSLWRCDSKPKKCIIVANGEVIDFYTVDEWRKI